jgi:hypothetical protein
MERMLVRDEAQEPNEAIRTCCDLQFVRKALRRGLSLACILIAISSQANPAKESGPADSVPQGFVHLVVKSDADAQQIFTSFWFPRWIFFNYWSQPLATGIYRLEVNPAGGVSAVTILKSMGGPMDIRAMKTFVRWRAKPGSLRLVDVHCMIPTVRGRYRAD